MKLDFYMFHLGRDPENNHINRCDNKYVSQCYFIVSISRVGATSIFILVYIFRIVGNFWVSFNL